MAEAETTTTETTTTTTGTEAGGTPSTETKAAAETTTGAETETKPAATTETKVADTPADYSKLALPEGYKADDPVFGDALKLFGESKIAPDVAQKLIDFTATRDKAMVQAVNDANTASWAKQVDGWKAASAKEFSPEVLGGAKEAFAKVFDAETSKYLEAMGLTNHPGLIRAMAKIHKAIKDDTFVTGNAALNGARDARAHFPNSNMNP